MKLGAIFDTKEIENFATALAEDLGRRFPPKSESRTDAGAKHQVKAILDGLAARAVRFRAQQRLGIYKKAKLANVFRWKLTDLGYSKEFVEHATKVIATNIATEVRSEARK